MPNTPQCTGQPLPPQNVCRAGPHEQAPRQAPRPWERAARGKPAGCGPRPAVTLRPLWGRPLWPPPSVPAATDKAEVTSGGGGCCRDASTLSPPPPCRNTGYRFALGSHRKQSGFLCSRQSKSHQAGVQQLGWGLGGGVHQVGSGLWLNLASIGQEPAVTHLNKFWKEDLSSRGPQPKEALERGPCGHPGDRVTNVEHCGGPGA